MNGRDALDQWRERLRRWWERWRRAWAPAALCNGKSTKELHNAMSWETRTRGTSYYTRSKRINGRIIRQYIGRGELAERLAAADGRERELRAMVRRDQQLERERIEDQAAPIAALHADVDVLVRAALLGAGYHRHHGEWRRRRG